MNASITHRFTLTAQALGTMAPLLLLAAGCGSVHGQRGSYIDFIRPDQHPPLVGAIDAADSLWGPADQSARGDGIAESHRPDLQALVEQFAPTLVLPNNDHVTVDGRKYKLLPTDMGLFADTLRLDLIQAAPYAFQDSVDIPLADLDPDSLVALTENALRYESDPNLLIAWYFNWPGESVSEWWRAYARFRTGPDSARWAQPTVYGHPFVDARGRTTIQYWYFYPFNDYFGNHEGDWEHVNVVLSVDRTEVAEVHYYFHARTITLPQGEYLPEIVDGTHVVVYVGGRMYNIFDYPIRILAGERNEGSHGSFPYPGEWEAAAGLGAPESVQKPDRDSTRVVRHNQFRVVLTPEPGRIDYRRHPEILRDWIALLLPVRWGFPSAPSVGSALKFDVGNRAPFGPSYNAAWNRTAPGIQYTAYHVKKMSTVRSLIEDLLQPWYYLYIFRTPRYVHDTRDGPSRQQLARAGLAPRGGSAEFGLGSPILGVHIGMPKNEFSNTYNKSTGVSLWRNLWVKVRAGAFEVVGGYQKFPRAGPQKGSMFVYPFTGNVVLRAPDALFRPYITAGAGAYGWESRLQVSDDGTKLVASGWKFGLTTGVGVEYYLRTRVALDVGVRFHTAGTLPDRGGGDRLQFLTLWIGHFVRF